MGVPKPLRDLACPRGALDIAEQLEDAKDAGGRLDDRLLVLRRLDDGDRLAATFHASPGAT